MDVGCDGAGFCVGGGKVECLLGLDGGGVVGVSWVLCGLWWCGLFGNRVSMRVRIWVVGVCWVGGFMISVLRES